MANNAFLLTVVLLQIEKPSPAGDGSRSQFCPGEGNYYSIEPGFLAPGSFSGFFTGVLLLSTW
jgi:hypothetical protein